MPNHGGDDVARFANRRPAARFLKPGGIAILRIQRAPGSKKQHDLTSCSFVIRRLRCSDEKMTLSRLVSRRRANFFLTFFIR